MVSCLYKLIMQQEWAVATDWHISEWLECPRYRVTSQVQRSLFLLNFLQMWTNNCKCVHLQQASRDIYTKLMKGTCLCFNQFSGLAMFSYQLP